MAIKETNYMKFGLQRTINLHRIDPSFHERDEEKILITDADSFEEATKKMEILVAERIGYIKGRMSFSTPPIPADFGQLGGPVVPPIRVGGPAEESEGTGGSSTPPAEFNIG